MSDEMRGEVARYYQFEPGADVGRVV